MFLAGLEFALFPSLFGFFSSCFSVSDFLYGELVMTSDPVDFRFLAPGRIIAFA